MVGNRQFADSDLKSLGGFHRAGSIPALGTNEVDALLNIWPVWKTGRFLFS